MVPRLDLALSAGRRSAGASMTFPLDIASAVAAFGLRRLSRLHVGPLIRVRRFSDNTEMDIGARADGWLDAQGLSTFVGPGSAYGVTWYDQSGNGRHVTQTTAASQPRIVDAGVLDSAPNGRPWLWGDGTKWLMTDSFNDLPAGAAPSTIATVARVSAGSGANWMTAGISYGGQAVRGVRIVGNASTGFAAMPTINDDLISTLSLVGQHRSMIGIFRAASGTLHIDGSAFAKNYAAALATVTPSRIVVMARTGAGGPGFEAWRGNVAETMLFAGELSADQISALRVSHQNAWGTP